jgi:biopolymer transport protein ExbB
MWGPGLLMLGLCLALLAGSYAAAQEASSVVDASEVREVMDAQADEAPPPVDEPTGIDMLSLIASGGNFMIPIGVMSLLVVTLAAERLLSLRSGKVIPKRLTRRLDELSDPIESFDPPQAYQACAEHPSPTASVIAAMLLRTGQPLGDIERAAGETVQREADRYAAPIRWLNLAAAATPLMGLLGTVWGMIVAFHESTSLSADRSRSEQLSEGIYTALVTTLAGLAVAIPAAIFAQYLENRVTKLFHSIETLAFNLAPGLVRFSGRERMDNTGAMLPLDAPPKASGESAATPPPPPAGKAAVSSKGKAARAS